MSAGFHYLAGPYSHIDLGVQRQRAIYLSKTASAFLASGIYVYSPITMGCALEDAGVASGDWRLRHFSHEQWLAFCEPFVTACVCLFVLPLPGYMDSKGLAIEIEWAKKLGKPVYYIHDLVKPLLEDGQLGDLKRLELHES
jgi:Domain of unknown function (DUF1937)